MTLSPFCGMVIESNCEAKSTGYTGIGLGQDGTYFSRLVSTSFAPHLVLMSDGAYVFEIGRWIGLVMRAGPRCEISDGSLGMLKNWWWWS